MVNAHAPGWLGSRRGKAVGSSPTQDHTTLGRLCTAMRSRASSHRSASVLAMSHSASAQPNSVKAGVLRPARSARSTWYTYAATRPAVDHHWTVAVSVRSSRSAARISSGDLRPNPPYSGGPCRRATRSSSAKHHGPYATSFKGCTGRVGITPRTRWLGAHPRDLTDWRTSTR